MPIVFKTLILHTFAECFLFAVRVFIIRKAKINRLTARFILFSRHSNESFKFIYVFFSSAKFCILLEVSNISRCVFFHLPIRFVILLDASYLTRLSSFLFPVGLAGNLYLFAGTPAISTRGSTVAFNYRHRPDHLSSTGAKSTTLGNPIPPAYPEYTLYI